MDEAIGGGVAMLRGLAGGGDVVKGCLEGDLWLALKGSVEKDGLRGSKPVGAGDEGGIAASSSKAQSVQVYLSSCFFQTFGQDDEWRHCWHGTNKSIEYIMVIVVRIDLLISPFSL